MTSRSEKVDEKKKLSPLLDKRDEAIIHCIEQQPDILLKDIPKALMERGGLDAEIPYPTVQRRMNRLIATDVVSRNFTVNWVEAGYLVHYRVGILIDRVELQDKSKKENYASQNSLADHIIDVLGQSAPYKNKLVIDDVFILLGGRVDLAIDFYAKDDKVATQFIINGLRNLPGVRDTVSAKLAYSSKHKWLSKDGHDEGELETIEPAVG